MSPVDRTTQPTPWAVGDGVWVHAYSRWRRGRVVAVGKKRVRVNYSKRSTDDSRGEQWYVDDERGVVRGSLAEPVRTSCPECKVKLVHGRPGQPEESVIADHLTGPRSCRTAAGGPKEPSANGCGVDTFAAPAAGPGASNSASGPAVVPPQSAVEGFEGFSSTDGAAPSQSPHVAPAAAGPTPGVVGPAAVTPGLAEAADA